LSKFVKSKHDVLAHNIGAGVRIRTNFGSPAPITQLEKQTGTGGRVRLTLLIHGARSVLTHSKSPPEWLTELVKRRPKNVAVVAMANKMARTIWALTTHERAYQSGYVSRPA